MNRPPSRGCCNGSTLFRGISGFSDLSADCRSSVCVFDEARFKKTKSRTLSKRASLRRRPAAEAWAACMSGSWMRVVVRHLGDHGEAFGQHPGEQRAQYVHLRRKRSCSVLIVIPGVTEVTRIQRRQFDGYSADSSGSRRNRIPDSYEGSSSWANHAWRCSSGLFAGLARAADSCRNSSMVESRRTSCLTFVPIVRREFVQFQ